MPPVPGLQEWRQHQARVREEEQRLASSSSSSSATSSSLSSASSSDLDVPPQVPGLQQWRAHQAAALQKEKVLSGHNEEASSTSSPLSTTSTSSTSALTEGKRAAALKQLQSLLQASVKRFISKAKHQQNKKTPQDEGTDERIFKTLVNQDKTSRKTSNSFLDQLLESYGKESSRIDENPRNRGILSRLEYFDDPYISRSRLLYHNDIAEALLESRLLDRDLRRLLKQIEFD